MKIKDEHRVHLEKVMTRFDSPFFYYDLDALKKHLEDLCFQMSGDGIRLWYACKANPLSAVLKVIRNEGLGLDVASKGELNHVVSTGINPEHILSTGPAKDKKYLRELLEEGVEIIVCESLNQVYWLEEVALELGKKPRALLRVQLEWSQGSSVLGGDAITPFGEDFNSWSTLELSRLKQIEIVGLHVFQWGNILDLQKLESIWRTIAKSSKELAQKLNISLKVLDLGGGIGIPYNKEQRPIDPREINTVLKKIKNDEGIPEIWMELGRYAVGPFGTYFTKVIDRKQVRGKDILVLEGGINHIARPALTNEAFPSELFRKADSNNQLFSVHGPLCTAIDYLGDHEFSKDIGPGDWIAFHQSGAYGFTEGLSFFLCHNLPAEVIMYQGNMMTPRVPKTPVDWLV